MIDLLLTTCSHCLLWILIELLSLYSPPLSYSFFLRSYTTNVLQPGQVRAIMSTSFSYVEKSKSCRLKRASINPASTVSAFTHWTYTIPGFQESEKISLFPSKKLTASVDKPSPISVLDSSGRTQVHQVEYSRLAPSSEYSTHLVLFCPFWISNLTSLPITSHILAMQHAVRTLR